MSSTSIPSDSIILAPAEDRESKTPEMSFEDLYRVVVEMSTSLEQVTLQNNKLVQLNGELIKKVESLELSVKELKENCASKKTFAQVVTAGLKSSAAQVSFIKAAEIANDTEKRNAAVILDKVELPENVSDDGQFGQALLKACEVQEDSVSVFRLQKRVGPPLLKIQLQKKEDARKMMSQFNKIKSTVQGCSSAIIRPDLSKPERERQRAAWKEAVMKNNKAGEFLFTVRNLECVKVQYKEGEAHRAWEIRETRTSNTQLRVLSVYHPNHNLSYDSLLDCLKDLISVRGNCIIFGDFNAPHVDWANLKASDPKCRKLLSFSIKCGLKQHVMSPTRLNPDNVLDLCFTNTDIVNEITVGDLFSDHRFVHVSLSRQRKNSQKVSTVKCFRKGSFDEINCILSRIDWDFRFSTLTVEEMYQDLVALLSNLIDKFIPVKILKPSTKLHSSDIRKLQKKKLDVWRSEGNSVNYRALALLLRTRLSLEEKRITENRLCEGSSPHAFYKFVNSRWKSDEKIGILRDSAAGEDVTDDITKASLFSDTFSSVYTTDDGCASEFPVRTSQCLSSVDVSPHVVEFHLSHLPLKANTTPEGIPSIFLKRTCTSLALPLSIIYQRSLQYSIVPTVWKSAIVKPLYKKGSRCDPK
uniref:Endo/exonuclease/phosphatase domain-containing protein n=4 Tax=Caenorhabditis japonica TaxID=281687 RepID=A0A8R1IP52_CAEJA